MVCRLSQPCLQAFHAMATPLTGKLTHLERCPGISRICNVTVVQLIILLPLEASPVNLEAFCGRTGFGPDKITDHLKRLVLLSGKNRSPAGFIHRQVSQSRYVLTEQGRDGSVSGDSGSIINFDQPVSFERIG